MTTLLRILRALKVLLIVVAVIGIGFYGLSKYKNRRISPDYYEAYKTQDTVPEGKVGLLVVSLIMPPTMDDAFFYNITHKIFKTIIPWPFRALSVIDKGVALLDPVRFHEHHEFTPTSLIDPTGSDRDHDGEPYIEKYKRGEMVWTPPSKRIYLDHGYFLYQGRKGGMPSLSGKTINKARVWYYDKGIRQKRLPHWEGSFSVINQVLDRIRAKYGALECRAETSMHYHEMKQKLDELLDAGCETIVLAAPMAIYSHFEEFNSSFYHCFEYIREWEQAHPGKKIKVIMAPPMGQFAPLRQAYLEMLKDRLDTLPRGASVTVAVTVHGMPWDHFAWEAWLELGPPYRDAICAEIRDLLKSYAFSRTNVVVCQDEFADPVWDPKEKYLSTNRAYWNAINEGYEYAIGLPIEFFAENSDTLFHHALKNYHKFDAYDVYAQIDYSDWSVPYTREMKQGKTTVIYNGVPVGKYQKHVVEAFFQAVDAVLSRQKKS